MLINQNNRQEIKEKILSNPMSCCYPWCVNWMLQKVKELTPGSKVLELGTFVAGTTRAIALANPDIIVHSIDLHNFLDYEHDSLFNDLKSRYELDFSTYDLFEVQRIHIEDCSNVHLHIGRNLIDVEGSALAFIDANHGEEAVLEDLYYAWNNVVDGAYIFGDDVDFPGVYNALIRFSKEKDIEYSVYSKFFRLQKTSKRLDKDNIRDQYEYMRPFFKQDLERFYK